MVLKARFFKKGVHKNEKILSISSTILFALSISTQSAFAQGLADRLTSCDFSSLTGKSITTFTPTEQNEKLLNNGVFPYLANTTVSSLGYEVSIETSALVAQSIENGQVMIRFLDQDQNLTPSYVLIHLDQVKKSDTSSATFKAVNVSVVGEFKFEQKGTCSFSL